MATALRSDLEAVLGTLSLREREVVRMRFGLATANGKPATLEEVGAVFALTRERIRQIEASALRKLRQPLRQRPLVDHLRVERSTLSGGGG